MKNFDFGVHISLPTNNLEFADGIASCVQKVAIQMQEKIDEEIIREIVKVAKEQGITDVYILDKQNILQALKKQIPTKPIKTNPICYSRTKDGQEEYAYDYCCSLCGANVNKEKHHCPCGQTIDWSDT